MEKKFNINIGEYRKEEEDPIIKIDKPSHPQKTLKIISEPPTSNLNITEEEELVESVDENVTEIKVKCIVTGTQTYHWTKKDGVIKDTIEEHEVYKASILAKHPGIKNFREAYKLEQEVE